MGDQWRGYISGALLCHPTNDPVTFPTQVVAEAWAAGWIICVTCGGRGTYTLAGECVTCPDCDGRQVFSNLAQWEAHKAAQAARK